MPPPPAPTSEESEKAKPSLKLGGGKKKTKLKLGGGKSGSGGLPKGKFSAKITRPPMAPGSLPPPPPPES